MSSNNYEMELTYFPCIGSFSFLQERFYFSDSILPVFESGIPLLKQRLQQLPESEKVNTIVSIIDVVAAFLMAFDQ